MDHCVSLQCASLNGNRTAFKELRVFLGEELMSAGPSSTWTESTTQAVNKELVNLLISDAQLHETPILDFFEGQVTR